MLIVKMYPTAGYSHRIEIEWFDGTFTLIDFDDKRLNDVRYAYYNGLEIEKIGVDSG